MAFTTYVINLDDQPGRYQAQSSALLALDIYPVRVSGWRHEAITEDEMDRHFLPHAKWAMPRSNMGCCYSHIKTIEHFLHHDDNDVALILEDDAYPKFTDRHQLDARLRRKGDWDMLSLHCDGMCPRGKPLPLSGSAAAYFITKEGARKVVNHRFQDQFDLETNRMGDGFRKVIDDDNSFWTDEDSVMSEDKSTNRKKESCPSVLRAIRGNRGEKNLCHGMSYKLFRVPVIGYEMTSWDILTLLILVTVLLQILRS